MSTKSDYDIQPGSTFGVAARAALRHQLEELMDNLPGTRAGDDMEALHDMRVASRRLRAALSVFAGAFPEKEFRPVEKKAAQVTDALGAVRDADVQIEFMQGKADNAPAHLKVGLDAFIDHLKAERDRERVYLVKALDALEKGRFRKDFLRLLGEEATSHG